MPPIDPLQLKGTFRSVADLFETAQAHDVTIDSAAMPTLLGGVELYCRSEMSFAHGGEFPQIARDEWRRIVIANQGEMLLENGIIDWFRKWFPGPVQAGLIRPIQVKGGTGEFDL